MKGLLDSLSAIGPLRAEVRGYSCRAESVVQHGFYDDVVAFDVVVDREWEMWYTHAMVAKSHWMNPRKCGQVFQGLVDAFHEWSSTQSPLGA